MFVIVTMIYSTINTDCISQFVNSYFNDVYVINKQKMQVLYTL